MVIMCVFFFRWDGWRSRHQNFLVASFESFGFPAATAQQVREVSQTIFQAGMRSAFKPVNPVENLKAARREIAQDEFPARLQHPQHFLEHPHRALQMVKGVHAGHRIETGVGPGQLLRIMNDVSNGTTRPGLANVAFRQPLLVGVNIECRDMFRVFRQFGKETALAGADFQHVTGQRKDFREDELQTGVRIVAKSPEQCLAFGYGLAALGFKR